MTTISPRNPEYHNPNYNQVDIQAEKLKDQKISDMEDRLKILERQLKSVTLMTLRPDLAEKVNQIKTFANLFTNPPKPLNPEESNKLPKLLTKKDCANIVEQLRKSNLLNCEIISDAEKQKIIDKMRNSSRFQHVPDDKIRRSVENEQSKLVLKDVQPLKKFIEVLLQNGFSFSMSLTFLSLTPSDRADLHNFLKNKKILCLDYSAN